MRLMENGSPYNGYTRGSKGRKSSKEQVVFMLSILPLKELFMLLRWLRVYGYPLLNVLKMHSTCLFELWIWFKNLFSTCACKMSWGETLHFMCPMHTLNTYDLIGGANVSTSP